MYLDLPGVFFGPTLVCDCHSIKSFFKNRRTGRSCLFGQRSSSGAIISLSVMAQHSFQRKMSGVS
jgi:hypothetical protein